MTASRFALTKTRTAGFLQECVGQVDVADSGDLSFAFGSTRVHVTCSEDAVQEATLVHLSADVAHQVPVSARLYEWLATASNGFVFGRLTLTREPARAVARIDLQHTLLGDYLDLEELRAAVVALASTADELDDLVITEFGGQRHADLE